MSLVCITCCPLAVPFVGQLCLSGSVDEDQGPPIFFPMHDVGMCCNMRSRGADNAPGSPAGSKKGVIQSRSGMPGCCSAEGGRVLLHV